MRNKLITIISALTLLALGCGSDDTTAGGADDETTTTAAAEETTTPASDVPSTEGPYGGYNLFAPVTSKVTYLTDMDNNVVWSWDSDYTPGLAAYLLEDGSLLRAGYVGNEEFEIPGAGGIIQIIAPDGEVTWEYEYSSDEHLQHHDIEMLPNGNILLVAWEKEDSEAAAAAGRAPGNTTPEGVLTDSIIEVKPTGDGGGEVVWEWHAWDHLVQDTDESLENYGEVAEHPELIDVNYIGAPGSRHEWTHFNSVTYNAELDQIMVSVRSFSEIWVIDHSTTTEEAAGHTGGASGKGGDLLYRWGNPSAYGRGDLGEEQLFVQHCARWIPEGYPGTGDIVVFNNGTGRPEGKYSTVTQFTPPVTTEGTYELTGEEPYGPTEPSWTWEADPPDSFYASVVSSAQRLPNGNTLIANGPAGLFLEVDADGNTVWEWAYESPVFKIVRYGDDYAGLPDLGQWTGSTTPTSAPPIEDAPLPLEL